MKKSSTSFVIAIGVLGILISFHPTLFSGFSFMQTDPGDTRFINLILEHIHICMTSFEFARLWNPPFFFPAKNVLAYSDVLLSAAPFYSVWRLCSIAPDTSFQLWLILLSVLNFGAGYFIFKRQFQLDTMGAAVGAFVLSFSNPKTAQLAHPQLHAHFFVLMALFGLSLFFARESSRKYALAGLTLFFVGCVFQFYSAFYWAWFFCLSLGVAFFWSIGLRRMRGLIFALGMEKVLFLVIGVFLSFLSLWPLVTHYLSAAKDVGVREWSDVTPLLPTILSWFNPGSGNWIYGKLGWPSSSLTELPEHVLSAGLLTTIVALIGIWGARKNSGVLLIFLTTSTLVLLSTIWFENRSAWRWVFAYFPGATGVRAVARIGVFVLFSTSLGCALFFSRLVRVSKTWALAIFLVCAAEQVHTTPSYNKDIIRSDVDRLADKIDPGCPFFLFTHQVSKEDTDRLHRLWEVTPNIKFQLDAAWASLLTSRPTLNGYSGNTPPHWTVGYILIHEPWMEKVIRSRAEDWMNVHRLDPSHICWINSVQEKNRPGETVPR